MQQNEALTQDILSEEEQKWEEEWMVITNTKGKYTLSKMQAIVLKEAIAKGNRGMIMFETFSISIPYIAEFYRTRRFLKEAKQLPARATEEEYKPMSPEKFAKLKKKAYRNIGKSVPKTKE